MKRLTSTLVLGAFLCFSAGLSQETSQSQTNPTQEKDVPKQGPGTNNPDIAPGHQRAPGTKSRSSGDSSGERDVPKQKPGTNNPDVAKQRHSTPKKHAQKSTDQSGTTE